MNDQTFTALGRALRADDVHHLIVAFGVDEARHGQVEVEVIADHDLAVELGEVDEDPEPTAAEVAIDALGVEVGLLDPTTPESVVVRQVLAKLDRGRRDRARVARLRQQIVDLADDLDEIEEALAGGDVERASGVLASRRAAFDDRMRAAAPTGCDESMRGRLSAALFGDASEAR